MPVFSTHEIKKTTAGPNTVLKLTEEAMSTQEIKELYLDTFIPQLQSWEYSFFVYMILNWVRIVYLKQDSTK